MLKIIILLPLLLASSWGANDFCYRGSDCDNKSNEKTRYLLYDVNPPEGFNLRRDVYMRMAILVHKLQQYNNDKLNNVKLVLPPWSRLVHWGYSETPEHIPWSLYFDLPSLQRFAPVIEMTDFFEDMKQRYKNEVVIDEVYILQHFEDMFKTGNFEERMKIDKCQKLENLNNFYYKNFTSNHIMCLSFHGPTMKLKELLLESDAKTIMIHHAEVALHNTFGDQLYWRARRSMRFSKDLRRIADNFRKKFLNSDDENDQTIIPENWKDEQEQRGAIGGPYLSAHLRRRDFVRGRPDQFTSIENIAKQIINKLEELNLKTIFIATDGNNAEFIELKKSIPQKYTLLRYLPNEEIKEYYKDGGIAIIDQIICAHSRYFIGTHESTFSFRIQEEREILGFPVASTFNSFCTDNGDCPKPSMWKIVY